MKVTQRATAPGIYIVECPDCHAGRTFVSLIDANKHAAKMHVCRVKR